MWAEARPSWDTCLRSSGLSSRYRGSKTILCNSFSQVENADTCSRQVGWNTAQPQQTHVNYCLLRYFISTYTQCANTPPVHSVPLARLLGSLWGLCCKSVQWWRRDKLYCRRTLIHLSRQRQTEKRFLKGLRFTKMSFRPHVVLNFLSLTKIQQGEKLRIRERKTVYFGHGQNDKCAFS